MSYVPLPRIDNPALQPVRRRVATFLTVLAVHVGLILLLVLSKQAGQQKKQGSLSVFSLAAAASAPPAPIVVPIISAETQVVKSSPAEVFAEQQSAEGDPNGEICSPVDAVTAQLTNDPIVPLAINRVPRDDRSISQAIVMWNAEWSSSAANDDAPLAEVRDRILLTLETLPPDCLAMPVVGPRLIPITEGGSTTFLAFGSGEWSWQQVIEPPDTLPADSNDWTWQQLLDGEILPIV